jgi:flagellar motor switch/type III secretory pathway protein FliN
MATAARMAPVQPQAEAQAPKGVNSPIDGFHWLTCKTTAEIGVPKFTVGDLLKLRKGDVVRTATPVANDIPVRINQTLLGWGRFEVVNDRRAVRITELA